MKKKSVKSVKKDIYLPILGSPRTFGQRAADSLTKAAGSWTFIILFLFFIALWIYVNIRFLAQYNMGAPWDPYPFILLNLLLSCLAAIQAPVILMSQNRQTQRDRIKSENDYRINKKAEEEIKKIKNLLMRRKR